MKTAYASLPTDYGMFVIYVYPGANGQETIVLTTPNLDPDRPVLVRAHSECMTGDTFGSLKCDCGQQKEASLKMIAKSGNGMLVYLRQEGRGIGLYEKIKAYKLQESGYDTHEANIKLGHEPDRREYSILKDIFRDFKIKEISLLTNNPNKISEIARLGVKVLSRVPLVAKATRHNKNYFAIKQLKFHHFFDRGQSNYFFGVHGIDSLAQLKELGKFMKDKRKDPLLKICVSDKTLTHKDLESKAVLKNNKNIFKAAEDYDGFVPILHFSFKDSVDPVADLKKIKQIMPYVRYIQLNDIPDHDFEILKLATKYFIVDFTLHKNNFDSLINDEKFIDLIIKEKVFILLDNSHGQGIKESGEIYKKNVRRCLDVGINNLILAGGFGPEYLDAYFQISNYFKINFSIDAESGLRTKGKFDVKKTKKYLTRLLHNK